MNKQETRRAVIREWMGLSRDKRQTEGQATSFVKKAMQRHELPRSRRAPHRVILGWCCHAPGSPDLCSIKNAAVGDETTTWAAATSSCSSRFIQKLLRGRYKLPLKYDDLPVVRQVAQARAWPSDECLGRTTSTHPEM
jgi:hypothetical protein